MIIERILLLEDDPGLRKDVTELLRSEQYHVCPVGTLAEAHECLNREHFDLILADVRLPDGSGSDLLAQLRSRPVRPLIVMITGFGSPESAVEALRNGAFAFLLKPFSSDQLGVVLQKAEEQMRLLTLQQQVGPGDETGLLGSSPAMAQLHKSIRAASHSNASVLICGEAGSGKRLAARALHRQSFRAARPLIEVDCAAFSETLLEGKLFGSARGGGPGGAAKIPGCLELAEGGTVLLHEIAATSPTVQERLLRLLREKAFTRVGNDHPIRADVRVVATSSRPLERQIASGKFRQDLFFALNLLPIVVPPLRERREDLPALAEHFRERFARKYGLEVLAIASSGIEALKPYAWPGNVRELRDVIERSVARCCDSNVLKPEHLPPLGEIGAAAASVSESAKPDRGSVQKLDTLAEVEKKHILVVLDRFHGNRTHAAEALDISVRTLRNKLREYREAAASPSADRAA
jgi:DNA-binding NtrC family response regulator